MTDTNLIAWPKVRQLPRAFRAFRAVLCDRLFLNLPERDRPAAAADLDDASLVAWSRWAMATVARAYKAVADRDGRSVSEVTAQKGIIALALATLNAGATKGTFEVSGVTYRGHPKGDWRVTIEQIATLEAPND